MSLARYARSLSPVGAAAVFCLLAAAPAARAQGTVVGRVTAQGTNEPLADARVLALGTNAVAATAQDGKYTLNGVRAGTIELQVLRVGYQGLKKSVTVTAGGTVTADFELTVAVVKLQDVVTTATGQQRKVELGNALSTLGDVNARVEGSAVTNISDLLVAKSPGVFIRTPSMAGAAPVINIRGLNSLSLTNNPIVIVDGARFNSASIGGGVGGTNISYLNNLDPEDIEDIEIVKGPSAATLYGTDAGNGVIVITTKKGHAGSTKWSWFAEGGTVDDRNHYPTSYALWGHNPATGKITRCELATMSATTCVADSTTSLNIPASSISPLALGNRNDFGGQVSGGTDQVRFFVSSDIENELGTYKMPGFAQEWLTDSAHTTPLGEWIHPEAYQKENIRVNMNAALNPKFDLSVNTGFSKSDQRLPEVDNNVNGIGGAMYLTYGTNHAGLDYTPVGALGEGLYGYARYTPASVFQFLTEQGIQRLTGSADAQWRPFQWMQNQGTVGLDYSSLNFFQLCPFNECPVFGSNRLGFVTDNEGLNRILTGKIISTSTWNPRSWASVKTTFGGDYLNNEQQASNANGSTLPPGAQTVGASATKGASDTQETAVKTLGVYVQEQAALRDRIFLTAAVRSDQNSAFGTNFQRVFYPKASLSWIMSDESFFPKWSWVNSFRVRTAWGESGVQPGATSSLKTFAATTSSIANVDVAGLTASAIGNPNLKPETAAETEAGFDTDLLNRRLHLEVTYYSRQTSNALVSVPIAASAAPSSTTLLSNLGSVKNGGIEAAVTMQLLDARRLGWDMTVSGSHNSNKVVSLGLTPAGTPNKTIGTGAQRDSIGFPINGLFIFPYTYTDANKDGIIQSTEVTVNPVATYFGNTFPRDIVSIQNGIDLFQRKLRLNALVDYKGGYSLFNNTLEFICQQSPQPCAENEIASTPLWMQARAVAQNYGTVINGTRQTSQLGYWENGQFWRFRELSATIQIPQYMAQHIGRAADANLSLQMRNVHVWTKYTGVDPEASYGTGDTPTDFITQPPRTYFVARLNLHY